MSATTELILSTVVKWTETATKSLNSVKEWLAWIGKASKDAWSQISTFWNTFKSTFSALASYDIAKNLAQWFANIAKSSIDLASGLEQTKVAFTTMTGSARIADAFIREMTQFAKTTPFEIWQIETASKQLLAFGIEVQNVLPTMKMLWDVASGVWMDKLPQLILAFGQVSAATKLTGNELRQFTEAWVPLLEELSKTMWKSVPEIQKMVSEWKVGFPQVEAAFKSLTWEGWRFFNLMENQSKTFWGMVSNFRDTLTIMLRDIGTEFLPWMKEALNTMMRFWDESGKGITVSFIWFLKEIGSVLATSLQGFATMFDIFGNFISWNQKDSTNSIAVSWKNLFLYLDVGFKAVTLAIKVVWKWIAYEMINAFASSRIALQKFQDFSQSASAWFVGLWKYIGTNLQHWVETWVQWAMWAMDQLIWLINKIPWITLDTYGQSFKATGAITMAEAMKSAEWALWITEWFWQKAIALEKEKSDALIAINAETKSMIMWDLTAIEGSFLKFKSAQDANVKSGETLAKVLAELWRVWKWPTSLAPSDWKWKSEAEKALDKLKKQILDIKWDASKLSSDLIKEIDKQKESISTLNKGYEEMQKTYSKMVTDQLSWMSELTKWFEELKQKNKDSMDQMKKGYVELANSWAEEIQKLRDQIFGLSTDMASIQATWVSNISKRAIEAQRELEKLVWVASNVDVAWQAQWIGKEELLKQSALGKTYGIGGKTFSAEDLLKVLSLTKELSIAKQNVTAEDLKQGAINTDKTQVELILEKMAVDRENIQLKIDWLNTELAKKQEIHAQEMADYEVKMQKSREAQALEMLQYQQKIDKQLTINSTELKDYSEKMKEKSLLIQSENIVYQDLIKSKQKLDNEYFAKFWVQLQAQLDKVETLASRLRSLNMQGNFSSSPLLAWARATWWPVTWWSSYLVWERWPEIFTPWISWSITPNNKLGSSIVINISGVFGRDAVDQIGDAIVGRLKTASYI